MSLTKPNICPRLRWFAEITYRTNQGDNAVMVAFDEIEDLHDIVERGPNFYGIKQIIIEPQHVPGLTGKTIETLEAE